MQVFWTNHWAEKHKTNTILNYFRHSAENFSLQNCIKNLSWLKIDISTRKMCNELSTYRCSEWRSPSVMAKPVDETRLSYTRVANKHHFEHSFWCGGLTNRRHTCLAHVLLWVPERKITSFSNKGERKILVKELDLFMCWLSTYKGCSRCGLHKPKIWKNKPAQ